MDKTGGVIFDMDGLMLDTERVAKMAWQAAAREAGREMSDALFASLIGLREVDSIEVLAAAFGPHFDFERTNGACNQIYNEYLARHGVPLKPGVRELLVELSEREVPLAVATSTQNPLARQRLEQAGLIDYFSVLVAGNEVARGKPFPDIYLEAVRRLGIDAASSFALEDSHAGVRAAHTAGLRVIMVPDLLAPTAEVATLAERVVSSLAEAGPLLAGV